MIIQDRVEVEKLRSLTPADLCELILKTHQNTLS